MLTTIKGLYENGIIRPLEKIDIKGKVEVIITFLETSQDKNTAFIAAAGSWKDIDTEKLKEQIYESRKISSRGEVKL